MPPRLLLFLLATIGCASTPAPSRAQPAVCADGLCARIVAVSHTTTTVIMELQAPAGAQLRRATMASADSPCGEGRLVHEVHIDSVRYGNGPAPVGGNPRIALAFDDGDRPPSAELRLQLVGGPAGSCFRVPLPEAGYDGG